VNRASKQHTTLTQSLDSPVRVKLPVRSERERHVVQPSEQPKLRSCERRTLRLSSDQTPTTSTLVPSLVRYTVARRIVLHIDAICSASQLTQSVVQLTFTRHRAQSSPPIKIASELRFAAQSHQTAAAPVPVPVPPCPRRRPRMASFRHTHYFGLSMQVQIFVKASTKL
jgi:hypothetical protein